MCKTHRTAWSIALPIAWLSVIDLNEIYHLLNDLFSLTSLGLVGVAVTAKDLNYDRVLGTWQVFASKNPRKPSKYRHKTATKTYKQLILNDYFVFVFFVVFCLFLPSSLLWCVVLDFIVYSISLYNGAALCRLSTCGFTTRSELTPYLIALIRFFLSLLLMWFFCIHCLSFLQSAAQILSPFASRSSRRSMRSLERPPFKR